MNGLDNPILIGGLAGSGKTELRQALEAHPEICMTRRTYLWPTYHGRFGDLDDRANLTRCLDVMLRDPHVQQLRPDVDRIRQELALTTPTYGRLFGLMHRHHAERVGARRWGEQLGSIVGFADEVFAAYPDARIIHLLRIPHHDPSVGAWPPWRRGRLAREAARWAHSEWLARANLRRHGGRYRIVRDHELQTDPIGVLTDLCEFLGEQLHPAMRAEMRRQRFVSSVVTDSRGREVDDRRGTA